MTEEISKHLEGGQIDPGWVQRDRESLARFVDALSSREILSSSPVVRRHIAALFKSEGVDLRWLADTVVPLLKRWPRFNELIESAAQPDAAIEQKLRLPEYLETLDDPLVHGLLRRTIVPDISIERLLTILRRTYPQWLEGGGSELGPRHLRVLVSLACQCFNNEYVYAVSSAEQAAIERLREQLKRQLAAGDEQGVGEKLVAYATYVPLWTLGADVQILQMPSLQASSDFMELVGRQIREPAEEKTIQEGIKSFGMSGEAVTQAVRQQYEESPYPRWLEVTLPNPVRYAEAMARRFPFLGPIELHSPVRILIAGCGTGRHPILVASQYSDATVLAVDISKASLAHAIRQARRYRLSNIEFLHGDLLRIEELGRQFDSIESVGVLHCLADPVAGFRALKNVLAPGGYMKIGVYSKRARLCLEPARQLISSRNLGRSPNDLRVLRQEVIAKELEDPKGALEFRDFSYLSGFRDLLCHVREVQFTPAELKVILENLNLSFLGYRGLPAATRSAYRECFPHDPDMRELELIDQFEANHPESVNNVFWVRKNSG